ncbi:MAG: hypothetical protein M3467_00675 [Actinomycetota bacterium]|nr:hypothetical protein [Actinomycetota bacterium]
MSVEKAFDDFQETVNADMGLLKVARGRAAAVKAAFEAEPDVACAWLSGSLRRSTQLDPVHDVDMVIEYDRPDWGTPGPSAAAAIEHVRGRVKDLLGNPGGSVEELVRRADGKNHNRAVKCFVDDPSDPDAFTIDVMPVLRQPDGTLLIPDARSTQWVKADPEHLIRLVEDKQRDWEYFRPMVRVLKDWRDRVSVDPPIKSLCMEVLAIECLPPGLTRPRALATFFTRAAVRVNQPIADLAGHCGPIQPDLDVASLRTALEEAADLLAAAVVAEGRGDDDEALRLWQKVLGASFPAPEKSKTKFGVPALITAQPVYDRPQG